MIYTLLMTYLIGMSFVALYMSTPHISILGGLWVVGNWISYYLLFLARADIAFYKKEELHRKDSVT